jgi:hypothetical protein
LEHTKPHIIYTAEDIARYLNGELTSRQMHDMEMAALDDSLLSDAMEGFAAEAGSWQEPLADLHRQFEQKNTTAAPVVPMATAKKINWWRYAAAVAVLGTTITLAYLFRSKNNPIQIAQNNAVTADTAMGEIAAPADTAAAFVNPSGNNGNMDVAIVEKKKQHTVQTDVRAIAQNNLPATATEKFVVADSVQSYPGLLADEGENVAKTATANAPAQPAPATVQNSREHYKANQNAQTEISTSNKPLANNNVYRQKNAVETDKSTADNNQQQAATNSLGNTATNAPLFTLEVLNEKKQALPYAQVNTGSGKTLFANEQGLLQIPQKEVANELAIVSAGYHAQKIKIPAGSANRQVIMQPEDVAVTELKSRADKKENKQAKMKAAQQEQLLAQEDEEAVAPVIGWTNYNNYLNSNLNMNPAISGQKMHGEIEILVRLDKNGNITNATVDKSLCKACDEEAIRLIKEGPRFDIKNKKERKVKVKVKL